MGAPLIAARLDPELVERAREKIGRPVTPAELIRCAVERLAEVEPGEYPPGRPGRKPRQRQETAA